MQYQRMATIRLLSAVSFSTTIISACGGGNSIEDQVNSLLQQADTKKTQALAAAVDTPCDSDAQCQVLSFATYTCASAADFKIYSTAASSTNQAETATLEQNALIAQALNLKNPNIACTALAIQKPIPVCAASHCQAQAQR